MSEVATHLVLVLPQGSNLKCFLFFFWEHLESSSFVEKMVCIFSTNAFMTHSRGQSIHFYLASQNLIFISHATTGSSFFLHPPMFLSTQEKDKAVQGSAYVKTTNCTEVHVHTGHCITLKLTNLDPANPSTSHIFCPCALMYVSQSLALTADPTSGQTESDKNEYIVNRSLQHKLFATFHHQWNISCHTANFIHGNTHGLSDTDDTQWYSTHLLHGEMASADNTKVIFSHDII